MNDYGILTLLPLVVVIVCSLKTKRTFESLLIGTFVTYLIIDPQNFLWRWTDAFFRAATVQDNQWVLMVCGLFGSLIALMSAARGNIGMAKFLRKHCHSQKSTLFVTWIMGVIIFVDDYLNIMTLSSSLKKTSDEKKIPREALAYVIDSTGAPVCALLPFSTWAIFFATLFFSQVEVQGLGFHKAIEVFYAIIPYIFYSMFSLVIVLLFIFNVIPKLGPMKKAYQRVEETGEVYSRFSEKLNQKEKEKELAEKKAHLEDVGDLIDFVLPLLTLIAVTIYSGELFVAIVVTLFECFIQYLVRGKMAIRDFCEIGMDGFCSMIPTLAIVFSCFVMQQAMNDIGMAMYVIHLVEPYVSAPIYPAIVFLVVSVINFATGSSWGMPALCIPILLPLAFSIGANPLLVMAAIMSGATFVSHACFYSDATVLTSSCCSIENMDHALSQLPYACIAGALSLVCYLVLGFLL